MAALAAWAAAGLLASAWAGEAAPSVSTAPVRPGGPGRADVPGTIRSARPSAHQNILAEMWERKLLSTESLEWSPEDMRLLLQIRKAEADGALEFLGARGSLAGLAVARREPGKAPRTRLTRAGYDRWRFLRTQEAIRFFEGREVETKHVFALRDLQGRPLFNEAGQLTPEGEALFDRARLGLEAHWRLPDGRVRGTTRPPAETR